MSAGFSSLEAQRIRVRYRRLVLLGRLRLPLDAARRIVGPDCAYHLYFRHAAGATGAAKRRHGRRAVRASRRRSR